ncbi:hypothetical protein [Microcoleus sp. FACHB-672]|uniref:hypothetical protein n=1 Tax=Microcoleus sp. FACHB-672 TaxID=2692825 RepID=UPI0016859ECE|nr:hypothetical protein [Microcoleus sp. FACHB-672]MBD2042958.1 hypothetical protein [Microcoleus sp. FACHB-672]
MNPTFTRSELQEIAKYHRLLLWSLPGAVVADLIRFSLDYQFINLLMYLAIAVFQLFALYNLARILKLSVVWIVLLSIGLFVPTLTYAILLLSHERAMKAMKAAGVKVGFMGADPNSI